MEKELLLITVMGKDKKGIVAGLSNALYRRDINIEDISQKIMDGYFVMTMLVDISDCKCEPGTIRSDLEKIGKKMKLQIQMQHTDIFKAMHRV